jgi:exopolyphosphatase/guanosine-5'-triphosphate,3'-diphosphate pyrophosphatase
MVFSERNETFAALDLGTTNCRLLVARPGRDGLRVVDSFSRIVRLGEGLDASGALSEAAIRRTIDALAVCAAKIGGHHVTRRRFVATEACRRASNCADFMVQVRESTGLELEVIPTHEEARLAVAGCAPLLDPEQRNALVFDLGGGSTEVSWVDVTYGRGNTVRTWIRSVVSLPFGVVSLTDRYRHRASTRPVYDEMVELVAAEFRDFDRRLHIGRRVARGEVQMLGSSGTVTTLAGIHAALPRYERSLVDGTYLDFADIGRICAELVAMSSSERAAQPCIGAGRSDLMIAGCAILEAICQIWPVGRLRVADRGVREGILAGLWDAARQHQWRRDHGHSQAAPSGAA